MIKNHLIVCLSIVLLILASAPLSLAKNSNSWASLVNQALYNQRIHHYKQVERYLKQSSKDASTRYERLESGRLLANLYRKQGLYGLASQYYKWYHLHSGGSDTDCYKRVEPDLIELYREQGNHAQVLKWEQIDKASRNKAKSKTSAFGTYLTDFDKTIDPVWKELVPASIKNTKERVHLETTCSWLMLPNGEFSDMHISKSSGNNEFDEAALASFQHLKKYKPFPAKVKLKGVAMQYTFGHSQHQNF